MNLATKMTENKPASENDVGDRENVGSSDQRPLLVFPRDDTVNENFEDACAMAADQDRPLHLTQNVVLHDVVRLRKHQRLVIQGRRIEQNQKNPTISGDVHSLFLLNNQSQLIVENVDLSHTLSSDDHRDVGAAVNLRYKGSFRMTRGKIASTAGFCCWAVQKSTVQLEECDLRSPTRSSVVCFGKPVCTLSHCSISDAGVHAICARGACRIGLDECTIFNSAARAIYAYANTSVTITRCNIYGTIRPDKAAIEVSAAGGGEASLTMKDCRVVDNFGAGVRFRGPVKHSLSIEVENCMENNAGGNVDYQELEEQEEGTTGLRGKAGGSSYRRGDWWCRRCQPNHVVVGKHDHCPSCGSEKSANRLLTVQEISQYNQGRNVPSPVETDDRENNRQLVTWSFDGDDDKGWIPYDPESNRQLEDMYQLFCLQDTENAGNDPVVILCNGKYRVNIKSMEQVNTETQFLRLVRRRKESKVA